MVTDVVALLVLPSRRSAQIPDLFMPHGLGHLMGIDTHDVGGLPSGVDKYKSLRMNRLLLQDVRPVREGQGPCALWLQRLAFIRKSRG